MIRRTCRRRRAFTLVEMLALLPVMLALTIGAYELADRVEGMQSREAARRVDDIRIRDVVRRIQTDAALATDVVVESVPTTQPETQPTEADVATTQPAAADAPDARRLTLHLRGRTVIYSATPEGIDRVEQVGDAPPVHFAWPLTNTQLDFRLEAAGPRARLVWILCQTTLTFDSGPDMEWRLAAVATVGRGGAP